MVTPVQISDLPNEMLLQILHFLPAPVLGRLSDVSKLFQQLSADNSLWLQCLSEQMKKIFIGEHIAPGAARTIFLRYELFQQTQLISACVNKNKYLAMFQCGVLRLWDQYLGEKTPPILKISSTDVPWEKRWSSEVIYLTKSTEITVYRGNVVGEIFSWVVRPSSFFDFKTPVKKFQQIRPHKAAVTVLTTKKFESFSGAADGTVAMWKTSSGGVIKKWHTHSAVVTDLQLFPTNNRKKKFTLISSSLDKKICIYRRKKNVILDSHTAPLVALAVNRNGLLLSSGIDGTIGVWEKEASTKLLFSLRTIVSLQASCYAMSMCYTPASAIGPMLKEKYSREAMPGVLFIGTSMGDLFALDITKAGKKVSKKIGKNLSKIMVKELPWFISNNASNGPVQALFHNNASRGQLNAGSPFSLYVCRGQDEVESWQLQEDVKGTSGSFCCEKTFKNIELVDS